MEPASSEYNQNASTLTVGKVDEVDNLSTNLYQQMDREKEEMEEETESTVSVEDILQLNTELQTGYKILMDLMSDSKKAVNWPFLESVETSAPDLFEDYKKRIEKPMWLKLMKQKFSDKQYETITEFVADFRLMLENCYRFNGPDHYISRRGQKLETMLEQKLNLLSREMKEKTSIEATSGLKPEDSSLGLGLRRRPKSIVPHDSTLLLNQLREEEQQKVRESRKRQMLDRKAEKEALAQEILDWEDNTLFAGKYRHQMRAMWELPQIGLFLFLCQGPLNIGEVMHYELERCFLIPRESSCMQLIMMALLSTPFQRMKIDRKNLMPYKVWEQKLRVKMQAWYKVFTDTGYHLDKTCTKLGFDEQFFVILGKKNPMEKKKYHELSYYKRVWIVKGLCDHLMQTQESLRETVELQSFPDQREYVLGTDGDGKRYIHFPQFCGADLRIYRQAPFKYPKLEIKPDDFNNKRKFPFVYKPPPVKKVKLKKKKKQKKVEKASPVQSPQRSRPSRLRQTPKSVVPLNYGDSSASSGSSGDEAGHTTNDTATELELDKDDAADTDTNDLSSADLNTKSDIDTKSDKDTKSDIDTKSEDRLSSGSDATIPYCDKSDSNSCPSSRDCSRESSPYPTPTDVNLGLRRSSRFDKSSDVSREASPLIDEDFGLRRSGRNSSRFKNIPPLRATRDLTSIFLDENSTTSNSSAFGKNSSSGIWKNGFVQTENSVSSDTGEDSNNCDIGKLFSTTKLGRHRKTSSDNDSDNKELTNAETSLDKVTKMSSDFREEGIGVNSNFNNVVEKIDDSENSMNTLSMDTYQDTLGISVFEQVEVEQNTHSANGVEESKLKTHKSVLGKTCNTPGKTEGIMKIHSSEKSETDDYTADEDSDQESAVENVESLVGIETDQTEAEHLNDDLNSAETFHSFAAERNPKGCEEKNSNADINLNVTNTKHSLEENPNECDNARGSHLSNNSNSKTEEDASLDIPGNQAVCGEADVTASLHGDCSVSPHQTVYHSATTDNLQSSGEQGSVPAESAEEPQTVPSSHSNPVKEEPMEYEESEINSSSEAQLGNVRPGITRITSGNSENSEDATNVKSEVCADDLSVSAAQEVKVKTEPGECDNSIESIDKGSHPESIFGIKAGSVDKEEEDAQTDISVKEDEACDKATVSVKKEADDGMRLAVKGETDGDIGVAVKQEDAKLGMAAKAEEHGDMAEEESSEEEEEEEKLPDVSQFELLADSVEALRCLTAEFAEQEPIIIRRGKKEQITRPPPRKKSVVVLHERLQYLLKELEPWEFKLIQATKRARLRLRKEMESYIEPPEEEESKWNTTDEETESGESDDDAKSDTAEERKDDSSRRTKLPLDKTLSNNNSRASTPVKLEEPEEIDISQRGRLRKRRIIPNNVEDQFVVKKSRSLIKAEPSSTLPDSDPAPSTSQPVIIQSGKPQLVDYSDILRQIRSASTGTVAGVSPILIKTTQGGRTVLTSVLPIVSGSGATGGANAANLPGLQNIRFLSPPPALTSQPPRNQPVRLTVPLGAGAVVGAGATRVSQHPTIQTLLSTTSTAGAKLAPHTNTTSSVLQLLPQATTKCTGALTGGVQTVSIAGQQIVVKPAAASQSPAVLMQQPSPLQKVVLQGQTTPQKLVLPQQTTPQKPATPGHVTPPKTPTDTQVTPRKIAPHTSASADPTNKGKVKYYAANASTLPINVVQQLLATRGAKLQTGPNQQSILFIPMESEGQTRNVTSVTKAAGTPIKHQFLSPLKGSGGPETNDTGSVIPSAGSADTSVKTVPQSKVLTSVSNTPILPKPQAGVPSSPVVTIAPGIQLQQALNIQTASQPATQQNIVKVSKTVRLADGSISLNVMARNVLPPTSPPRYPTNETVRNLLDKRKSGEEKAYPSTTYPCIASQLQGITPKPLSSSVMLKGTPQASSVEAQTTPNPALSIAPASLAHTVSTEAANTMLDKALTASTSQQQCVITSISPAKLNTLLLQTNAAGAKTIPSLIKLPSKAVLDSAVKAVVTSVHTSLPTVNIKVPSPTSLPSIGPRRNVTKTIQTMKSPIPVAPKVVTQNSGITTLSVGSANTTMLSSQPVSVTAMKLGASHSSPPAAVSQAGSMAGVPSLPGVAGLDQKKLLARLSPQTVLQSKGIVPMGYLTSQGVVLSKPPAAGAQQSTSAVLNHMGLAQSEGSQQGLQGMQLIQNSAGQLQLVPRTSPLLQQMSQKPNLLQLAMSAPVNTLSPSGAHPALQAAGSSVSSLGVPLASPAARDVAPLISTTSSPLLLPRSTALFTTTPAKSSGIGLSAASPVPSVQIPLKSPILRGSIESKSPGPGVGTSFILPQSGGGVLNPSVSPVSSQGVVPSPLLTMQQNLIVQGGGVQLGSPLISPLGLLQQGVALQNPALLPSSQNVQLLQNSLTSPALQQMVNVNPLLLNQLVASSANVIMNRAQLPISSVSMAGKVTNLVSSVVPGSQLTKQNVVYQTNAASVLSGAAKQVANLVNRAQTPVTQIGQTLGGLISSSTTNSTNTSIKSDSATKQFIFQYNVANQRLPSAGLSQPQVAVPQGAVKNLSTTFATVAHESMKASATVPTIQPPAAPSDLSSGPMPPLASPMSSVGTYPGAAALPDTSPRGPADPGSKTSPGGGPGAQHQKLLLFSIGGQLVTGQGVPVTLSDGVLKLLPQGKIQIANQTLTPAQIQQTLAKINQGLNVSSPPGGAGQQAQAGGVSVVRLASMSSTGVTSMSSMTSGGMSSTASLPQAPQPTISTQYKDHEYQHKERAVAPTIPHTEPPAAASVHTATIPHSSSPDKPEISHANVSEVVSDAPVGAERLEDGSVPLTDSEGKLVTMKSGVPMYVMPRSNNTQYVMKPMVYSSGYIVCPRTDKDSDNAPVPVVTDLNKPQEVFRKAKFAYGNEKEGFIVKAPVKTELNGKSEVKSADATVSANVDEDDDDDDESESQLVIDDSISEKEAALNLLTLANQALSPVKLKAEQRVDKAGDAGDDAHTHR